MTGVLGWLALFLLASVIVGFHHSNASAKLERDIKLKRIRRKLAEKEREQSTSKDE